MKAPAKASKKVSKAKTAAKDPDKVTTDAPDKRSKVRTTAKVTFDLKATGQKPTRGKRRQKQKKEGEEQAMALTGRKRRQRAAASSAGECLGLSCFEALHCFCGINTCSGAIMREQVPHFAT